LVSILAKINDTYTVMQKNTNENAMKIKGSWSHPTARKADRNTTSTGIVMTKRVISASLREAFGAGLEIFTGMYAGPAMLEGDSACRAVEILEINTEPTAPGRPLIITAKRANPLYRLTNKSRMIPVAVLITIAPNNGVQPCEINGLTYSLRWTITVHATAVSAKRINRTSGIGVSTKLTSSDDTSPIRHKVMRSPSAAAMGGAILSGLRLNFRQNITSVHMKEPRIRLDSAADNIPVDATIINSRAPERGLFGMWGILGIGRRLNMDPSDESSLAALDADLD